MAPTRYLSIPALLLAGCQTASRWGATEDTEWSARAGTARYADAISALGQPRETMQLQSGETKARWPGREMTINPEPGATIQQTGSRAIWRDMQFTSDGILLRAWMSDQRQLADSEAP